MVAVSELGVREAAEALRSGALTAEALAEALLARCAAASALNAFISLEPDKVRAAADAAATAPWLSLAPAAQAGYGWNRRRAAGDKA